MRTTVRLISLTSLMLVTFLCAWPAAAQQQTGGVVFEVLDTDGNPVSAVAITLESDRLQGLQLRETDSYGRARFLLLPPGEYLAEFNAEGYVPFDELPPGYPSFPEVSRIVFTPLLAHREELQP